MEVEFLKQFSKDIDKISVKSVKKNLIKLIELIDLRIVLVIFRILKKLVGHKSAYRVRIADYRVGFFLEGKRVLFARVVHRKDIYKVFP
jgi:mRNA interferase RelE/StbE